MFSKEKLIHLSVIFFVSLVAIFVHGYQFAVSDQEIFIPYILRWKDPSLFPGDFLFAQSSAVISIFYPLIGYLSKVFDLEVIFLTGFLIFQFFFLLAIYRLAFAIFKNKTIAYLTLPLFLLPKFIGGTATQTFDSFFGYRSMGVIFFIFYLACLFEKRWGKALSFAAIGFIFHPLSIIPSIFIFPVLYVKDKGKLYLLVKFAIPILALAVILAILFLPKDVTWLEIIKFRDNYLFPSTWSGRAWAAVFVYFSLVFVLLNYLAKPIKKQILLIVIVSVTVFLLDFLALEVVKIPHIAQLQLVRSIAPVAYVGLVLTPLFLLSNNFALKFLGAVAYVSLAINAFSAFLIAFALFAIVQILTKYPKVGGFTVASQVFPPLILTLSLLTNIVVGASKTIDFPKPKNDWIDLQLWAIDNTSKTAIFLVPPNQTGFRVFSQRPIVGDIKDGAVVVYSPTYAKRWLALMQDLNGYHNFSEIDFENLNGKYYFNYLVTRATKSLNFEKVYENISFVIYKI